MTPKRLQQIRDAIKYKHAGVTECRELLEAYDELKERIETRPVTNPWTGKVSKRKVKVS